MNLKYPGTDNIHPHNKEKWVLYFFILDNLKAHQLN